MKFIFLCVLSFSFLSFISCKSNKNKQDSSLPFQTAFKTTTLGSEAKGTKVVQSQTDLKYFEVANNNDMPKELLEVDLDKNTLIMVMAGMKNTGGFDVEITKITETKDTITVFYQETNPAKDAMVIMALTYPMHAVTIKKTEKEIVFEQMAE